MTSTPALILQAFPYGDTSRILRLLTAEHGLNSVIAKGARSPRSRFGAVLEPFAEGIATFHIKEGRDLHTLAGFELVRSRQGLGRGLMRFGGASLIAELLLRVGTESADPDLYEAVRNAFDAIDRAGGPELESRILAEVWAIIAHLGFAPALDACITCDRPIPDDADTVFDYTAGGVRCTRCSAAGGGRVVPAAARQALRRLAAGDPVTIPRTAAHWRLLARFLSHHVLEGGTLKSFEFIAAAGA